MSPEEVFDLTAEVFFFPDFPHHKDHEIELFYNIAPKTMNFEKISTRGKIHMKTAPTLAYTNLPYYMPVYQVQH